MSSRSKKTKASRFQLEEALSNMMLAAAIWHAAKGTKAEVKANEMMQELAKGLYERALPDAMLKIQGAVVAWEKEADGDAVAGDAPPA